MIELRNIDHIGIAVNSLDESIKLYELLGFRCDKIEKIIDQKVRVAFMPCGESEIELLEPTEDSSAVQKFIDKKGEGIHHIAVRVDDVEAAITELKASGVRMIDDTPRYGAGGAKIAFVHPKMTRVLIELCERR